MNESKRRQSASKRRNMAVDIRFTDMAISPRRGRRWVTRKSTQLSVHGVVRLAVSGVVTFWILEEGDCDAFDRKLVGRLHVVADRVDPDSIGQGYIGLLVGVLVSEVEL